jgi:hypothetical protein
VTEPRIPQPPRGPRSRSRDAIVVVFLAVVVLVLFEGSSVRTASEEMQPGFERDVVETVGKPTGWVADRLPFDEWGDDALAFLEDEGVGDEGGFDAARGGARGGLAVVTPDSFDPAQLGAKPKPPRHLDTLLVTGDSLAMPLDVETARRMADADEDVDVQRDPHVGTGISKSTPTPWWCSSGPTRASRSPARTARRSTAADRTGRRPTPTGRGG